MNGEIKNMKLLNLASQGKAKGSGDAVYAVCNCPFAEGRRVICKHMVALDLGIFPEKEQ